MKKATANNIVCLFIETKWLDSTGKPGYKTELNTVIVGRKE